MVFNGDLAPFFSEVSRLATEGERFFFLVNYELSEAMLFDSKALAEEGGSPLAFQFGDVSFNSPLPSSPLPVAKEEVLTKHPEPLARYKKRFDVVMEALRKGEISLINLTLATPIDSPLSLEEIYHYTKAKYKVRIEGRLVCFSPERFIHINREGVLTSHPMKGTISTSVPNAREVILNDPKELAEHTDMVRSMKAELARLGGEVTVPRFRYIDEIHTESGGLLQVSSEVRVALPSGWQGRLGEMLKQLLPAGSIAGVPKGRATELIAQVESDDRGYYSGVSGYFDGEELETSVMIRFIERRSDGSLIFHSGGGITKDSLLEREYQEVIAKIYLPL